MQMEVLSKARMSQDGLSLGKRMSKNSIRPLDLLVRESIQNSLDAALHTKGRHFVSVDFKHGFFEGGKLAPHFDRMGDVLVQYRPDDRYEFLAISDKGTEGLTGSPEDFHSNLSSLVYDIDRGQNKARAGGSCGVGKTTYLLMGIGLVIYYSRISDGSQGGYREIMAAMKADVDGNERYVTEDGGRGIAFFGRYVDHKGGVLDNETRPIVNDEEIGQILSVFEIEPYKGEDTGTVIIIPYLKKGLLEQCLPGDADSRPPLWARSIHDYIQMSIQRWYFSRLNNPDFGDVWLKASVDGKPIAKSCEHPYFKHLRDLYMAAKKAVNNPDSKIFIEHINKAVVEKRRVGTLAWSEDDVAAFDLYEEKYRDIHSLVGEYDSEFGKPVLTYMRSQGMAVKYSCDTCDWVPESMVREEGRLVSAVFVLNSDAKLSDETKNQALEKGEKIDTLEDYVRACEKSEHHEWEDFLPKSKIVFSISTGVREVLRKKFSGSTERLAITMKPLSAKLTSLLLDGVTGSDESSAQASATSSPRVKLPRGAKVKSACNVVGRAKGDNTSEVEFDILLEDGGKVNMELMLHSETGAITYSQWRDDFENSYGKPFPLAVECLKVSAKVGNREVLSDRLATAEIPIRESGIAVAVEGPAVTFENNSSKCRIHGVMLVKALASFASGELKVEAVE